eukprot:gene25379-11040_t
MFVKLNVPLDSVLCQRYTSDEFSVTIDDARQRCASSVLMPTFCASPHGVSRATGHCQVRFSADGFKLGDAKFDEMFSIDMKATLFAKPVLDVAGLRVPNFWRSTPLTRKTKEVEEDEKTSTAAAEEEKEEEVEEAARLKRQAKLMPTRSNLGLPPLEVNARQPTATARSLTPEGASEPALKDSDALQSGGSSRHALKDSAAASGGGNASGAVMDVMDGDSDTVLESSSVSIVISEQQQQQQTPNRMSEVPTSALNCSVDVTFNVVATPPMTSVPGPLLSMTGSLVARLAMKTLLPAFLELLSVDYERWASGVDGSRSDNAGSLVPLRRVAPVDSKGGGVSPADVGGGRSQLEGLPTTSSTSTTATDGVSSQLGGVPSTSTTATDGVSSQLGGESSASTTTSTSTTVDSASTYDEDGSSSVEDGVTSSLGAVIVDAESSTIDEGDANGGVGESNSSAGAESEPSVASGYSKA